MKERLTDIASELSRAIKHWNDPEHTKCLDKGEEYQCCAGSVGPSCTDALSDAARGAVSEIRTLRGRIEVSTGTALANAALAERYHLQLQEIRAWRATFKNRHGAKIVNEFGLNGEYRGAFELLDSILDNS